MSMSRLPFVFRLLRLRRRLIVRRRVILFLFVLSGSAVFRLVLSMRGSSMSSSPVIVLGCFLLSMSPWRALLWVRALTSVFSLSDFLSVAVWVARNVGRIRLAVRVFCLLLRAVLVRLPLILCLLVSGCGMDGMYRGPAELPSPQVYPPLWHNIVPVVGRVPAAKLGGMLFDDNLLSVVPPEMLRDAESIDVPGHSVYGDLVGIIESRYGLIYDVKDRLFRPPVATHDIDQPDSAGRPTVDDPLPLTLRQEMVLRVRFVRGTASAAFDTATLGGDGVEFAATVVAGVRKPWVNVTTEEDTFDTTTSTFNGQTFNTQRVVVPAGVLFTGLVGPLQHNNFRVVGDLQVSAFTSGVDRSLVDSPVEVDGPAGKWLKVLRYHQLGANLTAALKGVGVKLGGNYDTVYVFVRVDN